ncbi:hypothetical protein IFM89_000710, partial [Coptis chinensis]
MENYLTSEVELKEYDVDEVRKRNEKLYRVNNLHFDGKDKLQNKMFESLKVVKVFKGAIVSSNAMEVSLELEREKIRRYSHKDLMRITEYFTCQIGSGAYGDVFKGQLPNGEKVAVKKLKKTAVDVMEYTFMAEVRSMSSTSHRNLVRLYGYCFETNMKALVYEYLENGS